MAMIETINLTKRYGDLVALNNLNLAIQEGDCFGTPPRFVPGRAGNASGVRLPLSASERGPGGEVRGGARP